MEVTFTFNFWWILWPLIALATVSLVLNLIVTIVMAKQAKDPWYTFRKMFFSPLGIWFGWYWFLTDVIKVVNKT